VSAIVFPLNAWSLEYQADKTKVAADHARLKIVQTQRLPKVISAIAQLSLYFPFRSVMNNTEKLVSLLEEVENLPSSVLLDEDGVKIPQVLDDLFMKMCSVIQTTEVLGLHDGVLLRGVVAQLRDQSQQIHSFSVRYVDAQTKLRSRVPAEHVAQYQEMFAGYSVPAPTPDQAYDEDVKRELLRF